MTCLTPLPSSKDFKTLPNGGSAWQQAWTHILLAVLHRAAHKGDDTHLVVLALPVLQSQLGKEKKFLSVTGSTCPSLVSLLSLLLTVPMNLKSTIMLT